MDEPMIPRPMTATLPFAALPRAVFFMLPTLLEKLRFFIEQLINYS
jgi:hypothetical protein